MAILLVEYQRRPCGGTWNFHDTTEIITGDLPTPIKYYAPEIRDAYKNVEAIANQLVSGVPDEMKYAYSDVLHERGEEYK